MKTLFVILSVLFLQGCVSEAEKAQSRKADSFAASLTAETGQKWTVLKYGSKQEGYMVLRNDTTGVNYAYNVAKWDGVSYASFATVATPGDILSPLLAYTETHSTRNDDGTYDTWEETYYMHGGLRFSNTVAFNRDLETIGALKEQATQTYLSHRLQSEFSLSSTRADELARLTARYQRLENRRALTSDEKNIFAMNALGLSMNQVERALKKKAQGEEDEYEDMLETAARVNRTTPEQVGRFFEELGGL